MKAQWNELTEKLQEFKVPLEDLLQIIPLGKRYFRIKQKIEKNWKDVIRAHEKLDPFISDVVDSIPINNPWSSDDFKSTWRIYKDYLKEQHGLQMQSRMELYRLEWLKENTKDNPNLAIVWIKYWIARGSEAIYKVNVEQNNEQEDGEKTRRANWKLPVSQTN